MMDLKDVKNFESYDEIAALPGYVDDLPFEESEYQSLLGGYRLSPKLKCCFRRKAGVCHTQHNVGFVIRLVDGSVTVVGNECVRKLASDEQLSLDAEAFKKEQRRKDQLEFVLGRIDGELPELDDISALGHRLSSCRALRKSVFAGLPAIVSRRLEGMGRSLRSDLTASFIVKREYRDENGELQIETERQRSRIYQFVGIRFINDAALRSASNHVSELVGFRKAYDGIKKSTSGRRLTEISKGLSRYKRLISEVEQVEKYRDEFLTNDLRYLALMAPDRDDQLEACQFVGNFFDGYERNPDKMLRELTAEIMNASGAHSMDVAV
ncbi:hypothetical protein AAGT95_03005 [Salinicola lusitanus]|uniref:Uncharacterized protein n=1 Tax=Salinicola lusitanus TaxID=1949085 RepID=A0ABZ3CUT6_9GAMM